MRTAPQQSHASHCRFFNDPLFGYTSFSWGVITKFTTALQKKLTIFHAMKWQNDLMLQQKKKERNRTDMNSRPSKLVYLLSDSEDNYRSEQFVELANSL
jgi:hypothetical protein